jgi:hypothetical protein
MPRLTRRRLLYGLSLSAGTGAVAVGTHRYRLSGTDSSASNPVATDVDGFDPAVDGFGFDNYATPPESPGPETVLSRGELREHLRTYGWDGLDERVPTVSNARLDVPVGTVADRLYANANRLFGTRGYCYGMAAAAQWYAEEPAAIPVDQASASEITDVDAPVAEPSRSPVRDDVERLHRSQFLDPEAWARRWPLLRPALIDYRAQAEELRRALDSVGTVGVTISGSDVLAGHYILLYEYEVIDDGVQFVAYDPNDDADEHASADETHAIGVNTETGEPWLGSYGDTYDRFLFNPADRAIRLRTTSDRVE